MSRGSQPSHLGSHLVALSYEPSLMRHYSATPTPLTLAGVRPAGRVSQRHPDRMLCRLRWFQCGSVSYTLALL